MGIAEGDRDAFVAGRGPAADLLRAASRLSDAGAGAGSSDESAAIVVAAFRSVGLEPRILEDADGPRAVVASTGRAEGRPIGLVATVREPPSHEPPGGTEPEAPAPDRVGGTATDESEPAFPGVDDGWAAVAALVLAAGAIRGTSAPLRAEVQFHVGFDRLDGAPGRSTRTILAAGERPEAVVVAGALAGDGLRIATTAPGVLLGTLEVDGKVTHCGSRSTAIRPGGLGDAVGVNALEKGMRVIAALGDLEDQWLMVKTHPRLPPASCTIGVTAFDADAGYPFPAYFPDRARIGIRVAYPPGETVLAIEEEIERHVAGAAALDPWLREHPPRFSWETVSAPIDLGPDAPLARLLREVALPPSEAAEVTDPAGVTAGRSEAPFYAEAGIPAAIAGIARRTLGSPGGHGTRASDVVELSDLLARAAVAWSGGPDGR